MRAGCGCVCDWSETNIKNIKNITNHSKPLRDNGLRFYVCSMSWVMFYVCINIKPLGGCDRWWGLCGVVYAVRVLFRAVRVKA